jgi:hypothetical protein
LKAVVLGHVGTILKEKSRDETFREKMYKGTYGLNKVKSDVTQPFNIKTKCRYLLKNVCKVI